MTKKWSKNWPRKMRQGSLRILGGLQRFADRWWYLPLICVLAAIDNFIVVIPTDGILISSTMLSPRRWWLFAVSMTLGSTIGAILLFMAINSYGPPLIEHLFPHMTSSKSWMWTQTFFAQYGLLVIFIITLIPFLLQPAVVLASLADTPIVKFCVVIFLGRLCKYMVMAYLGSHAPKLLLKYWRMKE